MYERALLELVLMYDAAETAKAQARRERLWDASAILLGGLDHGHQAVRLWRQGGGSGGGGTLWLP